MADIVEKLGFWGRFAQAFVKIGSGAVSVGLWASQHPEILQAAIQIGQSVAAAKANKG